MLLKKSGWTIHAPHVHVLKAVQSVHQLTALSQWTAQSLIYPRESVAPFASMSQMRPYHQKPLHCIALPITERDTKMETLGIPLHA